MLESGKKWQQMRQAVLERTRRTVFQPLEPLFTIYVFVCACYLAGFVRFSFFDYPTDFSWATALQIIAIVTTGIFIPFLTGAVLMLYFSIRRLDRLVRE